jgi:hypothetical protein
MRRAITVVVIATLAVAVIAPAAEGRRKERYFQDLSVTGPLPSRAFFTVIYRDSRGNGKFKPRTVIAYSVEAQVSCNPGGISDLSITKSSDNPFAPFKQTLKKGRFATRFEAQLDPQRRPPIGDLNGNVKSNKVNGSFNISDWDPNPGARENCIASGSFSATPCGDPKFVARLKIPLCERIPNH